MIESLAAENLSVAIDVLQHAARYDAMRLETYRQRENLADRIRLSHFGSALALRFDDVGYFNRIYSADADIFGILPDIERYYSGDFGCELVGPPIGSAGGGTRIVRPGWRPSESYAWMFARDFRLPAPTRRTKFTVCAPKPSERQEFLITYLRAFEAQPDRFPGALRNMVHLFDRPELAFLMAWAGERPAGIAMMMRCEDTALFCGGAALPEFREMGCHQALLAARVRWAAESGCTQIYSWATHGGQSQANMERAGLSVAGITTAWRFSAKVGP